MSWSCRSVWKEGCPAHQSPAGICQDPAGRIRTDSTGGGWCRPTATAAGGGNATARCWRPGLNLHIFKYLEASATLFGYLFHIQVQYWGWWGADLHTIVLLGFACGLSAGCGLEAWIVSRGILSFSPIGSWQYGHKPTAQGEEFPWTVPILPNNPARQ